MPSELYAPRAVMIVDCVVLNAYLTRRRTGGGFRAWWRAPYGSDANLDEQPSDAHGGAFQRVQGEQYSSRAHARHRGGISGHV